MLKNCAQKNADACNFIIALLFLAKSTSFTSNAIIYYVEILIENIYDQHNLFVAMNPKNSGAFRMLLSVQWNFLDWNLHRNVSQRIRRTSIFKVQHCISMCACFLIQSQVRFSTTHGENISKLDVLATGVSRLGFRL